MLTRSKSAATSLTRRGFTLLELIVVLLILGILAAIAIPTFNRIQENSVERSLLTSAESVVRNANAIAASDRVAGGDVDLDILWEATGEAYGFDHTATGDLVGDLYESPNGDQRAQTGVDTAGDATNAATEENGAGTPIMLTLEEESGNTCKALDIVIDPAPGNLNGSGEGSRVHIKTDPATGEKIIRSDTGCTL